MSTPDYNQILTIGSIPTRTVVNCSITCLVCQEFHFRTPGVLNRPYQIPMGPVALELPEQWLWDIIDEFIYQYQSFSVWRSKAASKTAEELSSLRDTGQVGLKNRNQTM
jgi:hypothetical protein